MMVPLKHSSCVLVTALLALPWIVSATKEETMPSFLRRSATRQLADDFCPPGLQLHEYYNAYFTLDDKGEATYDCDESTDRREGDDVKIGEALRDVVNWVDQNFPAYDYGLQSVNTSVCIFPSFAMEEPELEEDGNERALTTRRRRRRKTWTYSSSGKCTRCTKQRHRFLGKTDEEKEKEKADKAREKMMNEKEEAEEAAKEACDYAKLADIALQVGKTGLEKINEMHDAIVKMAELLDDEKAADKGMEEVTVLADEVIAVLEEAGLQSKLADIACMNADESASVPDKSTAKKRAKDAEDAVKIITKDLEIIHEDHGLARVATKEVAEEVVRKKKKDREEEYKTVIKAKKGDMEKDDYNTFKEEKEDEMKHLEALDNFRHSMEYADDLEAWMDAYKDLLQVTIKHEFFKKRGDFEVKCLDDDAKDKFHVIVSFLTEDNGGGDIAIEDCSNDGLIEF